MSLSRLSTIGHAIFGRVVTPDESQIYANAGIALLMGPLLAGAIPVPSVEIVPLGILGDIKDGIGWVFGEIANGLIDGVFGLLMTVFLETTEALLFINDPTTMKPLVEIYNSGAEIFVYWFAATVPVYLTVRGCHRTVITSRSRVNAEME